MTQLLSNSTEFRVHHAITTEDAEQLRSLFSAIADEEGWDPKGEIDCDYAGTSYFAVANQTEIVGGAQMIHSCPGLELPICKVWPELEIGNCERTAELAVIAIQANSRGCVAVLWSLAAAIWTHCVSEGIDTVYVEVTPRKFRAYRRLGWPMEIVGPLRLHWGEECYPCRLEIAEGFNEVACRARTSPFFRDLLNRYCPEYQGGI